MLNKEEKVKVLIKELYDSLSNIINSNNLDIQSIEDIIDNELQFFTDSIIETGFITCDEFDESFEIYDNYKDFRKIINKLYEFQHEDYFDENSEFIGINFKITDIVSNTNNSIFNSITAFYDEKKRVITVRKHENGEVNVIHVFEEGEPIDYEFMEFLDRVIEEKNKNKSE